MHLPIRVLFAVTVAALMTVQPASAQQTVRIGAYYFPPYATTTAEGMGGMVAGLASAMNAAQDSYRFEIVPTSPADRYVDFQAGRFDMIAFENIAWGWQEMGVDASRVFISGEDIYVAAADSPLGAAVFDNVAQRRIAAVYGYHYGFADFNGDPDYVQTHFAVEQPLHHSTSLFHVLDGRADLAVVPGPYLGMFLDTYPEYEGRFMTGGTPDQAYDLSILVRRGGAPDVAWINAMLDTLRENGDLERLIEPYLE